MPTPIPPAADNEDGGIVCNGRGRMWAGERLQSVGYSVNTTLPCQNFPTNFYNGIKCYQLISLALFDRFIVNLKFKKDRISANQNL